MRRAAGARPPDPSALQNQALDREAPTVGAAEMRIDDVAFCVVDVETTGLQPGVDRVLEVAVVRCDSAGCPVDEWHTLVHPRRPVDGEWVHGITDAIVADAPSFDELVPRLLGSLDGAVLVAHNAAFDRRFLQDELARAGHTLALPYLCTMHMRRHVGLPAPVMHRLAWACWQAATPIDQAHAAISDARAVAGLLATYLRESRAAGQETVGELAMTAAAAQACRSPLCRSVPQARSTARLLPRSAGAARRDVKRALPAEVGVSEYQRAVAVAIEDFSLDGEEVDGLHALVLELDLTASEIAAAHRDFLAERLAQYLDDGVLSWEEYEQLRVLGRLLAVDGRWLEELVADVRPRYVAATLDDVAEEITEDERDEALAAPLSVCFTGPFEAMPLTRQDVETLAADAGMLVKPGVSAKLDLLVCRDPYAGTSKFRKAEAHGTVVIDQETFLAVAGAATPARSPVAVVLEQVAARRRALHWPSRRSAKTHAIGVDRAARATEREAKSASVTDQVFWCEAGGHEWTRPARRGRPPKHCPEHRT
jgi:DNA polymerase-3 subunit epsilon